MESPGTPTGQRADGLGVILTDDKAIHLGDAWAMVNGFLRAGPNDRPLTT